MPDSFDDREQEPYEHDDLDSDLCWTCCGDGVETSDDLMQQDPLWWDGTDFITCRNCKGSGLARDQVYG